MSTNQGLLAVSLLMPLVLASATANAGSTISDRSYWPSEARRTEPDRTVVVRRDQNFAFAYDQDSLPPALGPNAGASAWPYQGSPKSR
jgi:hypothetical protein